MMIAIQRVITTAFLSLFVGVTFHSSTSSVNGFTHIRPTTRTTTTSTRGIPTSTSTSTSTSTRELAVDTSSNSPPSTHNTKPFPNRLSTALKSWPTSLDPKSFASDYPQTKTRLTVTTIATFLTWYSHSQSQRCGAVLASSAVTLMASLWSPGLGQAAFCGSFTGMSSANVLTSNVNAIMAGLITSVLFEFGIHRKNLMVGLGGRLGFLSFIAVNIMAISQGIPTIAAGSTISSFLNNGLSKVPILSATIAASLGSILTILLRESSDSSAAADPVRAASVIGILSALLVGIHPSFGEFQALCMYGGAFTGMSTPSRLISGILPNSSDKKEFKKPGVTKLLVSFGIAGGLGGLIHALTVAGGLWSIPAGWGGKAGSCGFAGVLVFRFLASLIGL